MPNLIRNRVTERDIRDWLQENGYEGGSAKLQSVELHAIKRPGWKQLFRFSARIRKQSPESDELPPKFPVWGVVLDDERLPIEQRTQVFLFETEAEQLGKLEDLSTDMTSAKGSNGSSSGWMIFVMALFAVFILLLIAMVKKFYE